MANRMRRRSRNNRKKRLTRKYKTQRGGDNEELLPLSHFLKDVKTEEEYDAMSKEDQKKYEKQNVIPAFSLLLDKLNKVTRKDNKAYYVNLVMKLNLLLKNTIASNKSFFYDIKFKVQELRKDIAYAELQKTLDKVEELLNRVGLSKTVRIMFEV